MAPKKTSKTSDAKKVTETKTKKTTKTSKTTTKAKTATKTKKTTTKKKSQEEEPQLLEEVDASPGSEPQNLDVVEENTQEVDETVEETVNDVNNTNETKTEEPKVVIDDEKINAHRIFITRIAFEATKDDLEEYFKKFGTVYDAYCPKQSNYSSLNKGFGFISFDSDESIQRVFDSAPHFIMGREVIVDRATGTKYHSSTGTSTTTNTNTNTVNMHQKKQYQQQHQQQQQPQRRYRDTYNDNQRYKRHQEPYHDYPSKMPRRDRHYEREGYNPNLPPYRQNLNTSQTFDPNKSVSYVFSGSSRSDTRNHEPYTRTYSNTSRTNRERGPPKLFVGRIGFETSVHSLRTYFSQFGEVLDVYIPKDAQTQKGKGFGFLTFANKNSLHTVLDPSVKHVLDGREIVVDYAEVNNRRP